MPRGFDQPETASLIEHLGIGVAVRGGAVGGGSVPLSRQRSGLRPRGRLTRCSGTPFWRDRARPERRLGAATDAW